MRKIRRIAMRWLILFSWLAPLLAMGMDARTPAHAGEAIAMFENGADVAYLSSGPARSATHATGAGVYPEDRIETPPGAAIALRYIDGGHLTIHPNTRLMLARREQGEGDSFQWEIHLFMGKVSYEMASDPIPRLQLISPTGAAPFQGRRMEFETDGIFTYLNGREIALGDLLQLPGVEKSPEKPGGRAGREAAEAIGEQYRKIIREMYGQ